jgi:hypothetical protein
MCTSLSLTSQRSLPPRAEDLCELFAGISILVAAVRSWRSRSRRQQEPRSCPSHS